jgi:hypothetical protein
VARRALLAVALALAAFAAIGAGADELGTLFYTAQERARLDKLRRGDPLDPAAVPGASGSARELTGYVERSDGRTTVWIDGNPVTLAPRNAPKLDPRSVRGHSEDIGRVTVERKTPR